MIDQTVAGRNAALTADAAPEAPVNGPDLEPKKGTIIGRLGDYLKSPAPESMVSDYFFIKNIARIRELQDFLFTEAVSLPVIQAGILETWRLHMLRYDEKGRLPTEDEWKAVEWHTQALYGQLDQTLRRKYRLGELPRLVAFAPVPLIGCAMASLVVAVRLTMQGENQVEWLRPMCSISCRSVRWGRWRSSA